MLGAFRLTSEKNVDNMTPGTYTNVYVPALSGTLPSDALTGGYKVRAIVLTYANDTHGSYSNGCQELIMVNDKNIKKWHRFSYANTWGDWILMYDHNTLSDSTELANIVTAISGASNLSTLATALGESGINNMKIISAANITVPANGTYVISSIDCGLYFFRDCFDNGFSSFGTYHYSDGVNVISENNNVAISASNTSARVYISTSNNTMILKNNTDSDKIVTGFIVRSVATA